MAQPEIGDPEELREGGLCFEERLLDVPLEEIRLVADLCRLEALEEAEDCLVLLLVPLFRVVASEETSTHRPLQMLGILEERLGEGGLEAGDKCSLGRGGATSPVR